MGLRRAAYRARQFWRALLAYILPLPADELAAAREVLPEAGWSLFWLMPRNDRRHSLGVYRALRAAGYDARPLSQAALLHDCGKTHSGITLLHRVAIVLLRQFRPALLAAWAQGQQPPASRWRYPLWVHAHHPEIGAGRAASAGCELDAALLIRRHQERSPQISDERAAAWLAALQAADEDN
jgi:hypothetical protein